MTTQLNQIQIAAATQEKKKMPFDYEPLSASTQRVAPQPSVSDDRSQSSQPSSVRQPTLRPCIYLALRCSRCGPIRQVIAELPAQALIACPECSQECSFVLLGSGLTSRNLPFHQVHIIEPTRWDSSLDGETDSS
jgi:hypothetical protein